MTTHGEHDAQDAQDDQERTIQLRSFVALAWGALLVLGAVWLVNQIREYNRTVACLESGHSDCVPLKLNQMPAPDSSAAPSINRLRDPWAKSNTPTQPPPR
jgi:hypothetical protein